MTTVREDDYIHFYGLNEAPFALTPDPHFLFPTEANQKALQGIYSSVRRGEGYAVLTGDIGTGKTLICRALLELFERDKIETALLVNPFISEEELIRALLNDFGVDVGDAKAGGDAGGGARAEVQRMMDSFTDFLAERSQQGVRCVAIIDESQNLPISALEQLRIMGNLETNKEKLLQIVLVGQNEFLDALKHSRLMQLVQRISNWYRLGPMPRNIIGDYFRFRLEQAGLQKGLPISPEAISLVYKLTRGYPRLMNILFDRTLREVHALRKWGIDDGDVARASEGMPAVEDAPSSGRGGRFGTLLKLILVAGLLATAAGIGFWLRGRVPGDPPPSLPTPPAIGGTATTGEAEAAPTRWRVSVGEHDDKADAQGAVRQALSHLRQVGGNTSITGFVVTVRRGNAGERYRAVIGGFLRKEAAASAASVLDRVGVAADVHEGEIPTPR